MKTVLRVFAIVVWMDDDIKISAKIESFLRLFDNDVEVAIAALQRHATNSISVRPRSDKVIASLQSVNKTYRSRRQESTVLRNVSLSVYEGEIVAVTGPSGSGKSTLLHLLGGLDAPSSGKVIIDDVDLAGMDDSQQAAFRNKTIGFVFQFFYLQPFLSLAENISVPGMFGRINRKERRTSVGSLLRSVGLESVQHSKPRQLSGGQMQRAAVARALLSGPKLLLADEPTGNLDRANSDTIVKLFKRVRDEFGTTIVIVTHDKEVARQADREIRLRDGALV